MSSEVGPWVISGTNLTSGEDTYLANTYAQYVQILGMPVVYNTKVSTGLNSYGMNTFSFSSSTITAVVTNLTENDYAYVEPGLLPSMYASAWLYQVVPQVGDRIVWRQLDWEVRNSFPSTIGNAVIYYRVILKRIIADDLTAGG